ncbi:MULTISPECIES: DUF3244 domain-containing protein [Bacteroides]|mgnify:CR=1 FL=1|jgi:hypothetical protein|uniref:DUF3244 domain-containing protein n=1 Tax=Bacteroides TaxID=816 RepID=UPI000E551F84|nr:MULTISPECIES: DUF3244 domain-containing protein [Bacteroides]RHL02433.1 DUF3244 domain-containing protein [Bacteroides sp. AF39-11AC]
MKKLLFLLIAFLAWGTSAYSQEFIKGMEISLYGDIKKDNNVDPETAPKTRSIIIQPAHAYLYNKVISISFEEVMPAVTIKITKESTDETVYSQEYISPTTISVNLNLLDSGTYYIEISSDNISLQGEFPL